MSTARGWRYVDLVEESWRRLDAVAIVAGGIVTVLATGLGLLSTQSLHDAAALAERQTLAGVHAVSVTSLDGQLLNARACGRLREIDSVVASGAYYGENTALDTTWPPTNVALSVVDVSSGALDVWLPERDAELGIIVGSDYSDSMGIVPGTTVTLDGTPLTVTSTTTGGATPLALKSALVRVVPAVDDAPECWIRLVPGASAEAQFVAEQAFPSREVVAAPHAQTDDLASDPEGVLRFGDSSVSAGVAFAVLVVVLALRSVMGRREAGIYRTSGTSLPELFVMSAWQGAVVVALAGSVAVSAVLLRAVLDVSLPLDAGAVYYILQPTLALILAALAIWPLLDLAVASRRVIANMRG